MGALLFLLSVWLIGALLFFLLFIFGKYHVKVTNYKTNEVKFIDGIKRIGCFALMSLLWPYIIIKNLIKGE